MHDDERVIRVSDLDDGERVATDGCNLDEGPARRPPQPRRAVLHLGSAHVERQHVVHGGEGFGLGVDEDRANLQLPFGVDLGDGIGVDLEPARVGPEAVVRGHEFESGRDGRVLRHRVEVDHRLHAVANAVAAQDRLRTSAPILAHGLRSDQRHVAVQVSRSEPLRRRRTDPFSDARAGARFRATAGGRQLVEVRERLVQLVDRVRRLFGDLAASPAHDTEEVEEVPAGTRGRHQHAVRPIGHSQRLPHSVVDAEAVARSDEANELRTCH